ncbi:MAG TPA: class III poly(R)-hydroxyalkanoic acid synthase subunit PhaC, partial [Rubrobacteraceae bacterium]|nr:class III poly(R)-hydroxyalkanoic acid synthase subunit PhaC [Rubrobacteraceae bacterium]
MTEQQTTDVAPSELEDFFEKYNRGLRIVVEGAQADTGQTPKEVVWTKNKAKLYRYEPQKPKKYPVPILIVYALINRPYVLDLIPNNSLIEYLVGEGF